MTDKPFLHAYRVSDVDMPLVPAPADRSWMHNPYVAAERCLPIVMANQSGWFLLSAHNFHVHWTTNRGHRDALTIDYDIGQYPNPLPYPAESNFGGGILTFRPPYLFRTSPGYNLLVRGPANVPIEGAVPLEGLVETDWTASTFTINWQLTASDVYVSKGDPIAMLVPQRRGDLEQFETKFCDLEFEPGLDGEYRAYVNGRVQWKRDAHTEGTLAFERGWQRHYYQGQTVLGVKAPEHQTRRNLQSFLVMKKVHD